MKRDEKITIKYLSAKSRHKKLGNSFSYNESSPYFEKQKREEAKLFEQMQLENIKEIFLRNKVQLKGRRRAVTETELADQIRNCDRVNSLQIFAFNNLSNYFLKVDEWNLKEVKKIVMYQTQPKHHLCNG